jgi:hypothetical protein
MAKVILGDGVHTALGSVDYGPGDTVEVPDDTAERWVDEGNAELADGTPAKRGPGRPRKSTE